MSVIDFGGPVEWVTLRDYFIAHAPVEPPAWFKPAMPTPPQMPTRPTDLSDAEAEELASWRDALSTEELEQPRIRAFAEASDNAVLGAAAWTELYAIERHLQWPGFWADEQIKRRAGAPAPAAAPEKKDRGGCPACSSYCGRPGCDTVG